ncbi:MAG: GNAT family N-acetyltransferase, partial [Burkholderiales bacterium]
PLLDNSRFFSGKVLSDREIVWVDLSEKDLLSTYSTRARTTIRKAQKNDLKVEWWKPGDFAHMFSRFYLDHMQSLNADSYYYFPESYFRQLASWNQAQLAVCTMNGEILAAAIFLCGPHHMEYHLSTSTGLGRQLGATNLIIHEAALQGRQLGCSMLNLGGGTDAAPDNPLFFFKSGFSSKRATFSVGKRVHLPEQYELMKAEWEKTHGRPATRILFYR